MSAATPIDLFRGASLVCGALIFLILALVGFRRSRLNARRWPKAMATVRHVFTKDGARKVTLEFLDSKGRIQTTHTFAADQRVGLGTQTEIAWDGVNPDTAFICYGTSGAFVGLLALIAGVVVFLALGATLILSG